MSRLSRFACVFALGFTIFSTYVYIFWQKWFWFTDYIYLIRLVNNKGVFAIDVTIFMYGMWVVTLIAVMCGVMIGYVYGNTSKK